MHEETSTKLTFNIVNSANMFLENNIFKDITEFESLWVSTEDFKMEWAVRWKPIECSSKLRTYNAIKIFKIKKKKAPPDIPIASGIVWDLGENYDQKSEFQLSNETIERPFKSGWESAPPTQHKGQPAMRKNTSPIRYKKIISLVVAVVEFLPWSLQISGKLSKIQCVK